MLVVHPSLPVKSVSDLIKYAKAAKPGELFYATAGAGTSTHLAAELFNSIAGIKMMPVHYRGGGDTIKDLISGRIPVMFSTIPPVLGFVRDGQLRGLATTGSKRDFVLPELPTIVESGLPNFDVPLWFGLIAPKGTPQPVIQKLVPRAGTRRWPCRTPRRCSRRRASRRCRWGRRRSRSSTSRKRPSGRKVVHTLGLSQ